MIIFTKKGEEIDISPWVEQIRDNLVNKRCDVFEQTPIGQKADGNYFWWDEETNPDLDKDSVVNVKKLLNDEL